MKAIGVTAVPGEGSPFDPAVHDAIMRERSEDVPDGSVLQASQSEKRFVAVPCCYVAEFIGLTGFTST